MSREINFKWLNQLHRFDVGEKVCINIGCGFKSSGEFISVDKDPRTRPNILHDVEEFPWPFEDDCASVILLSHIVEHIKPWLAIDFINECWRIMEFDGLLIIIVPYGLNHGFLQDPTHIQPWVRETPFYFIPGNYLYDVYQPKQWKIEKLTYNTDSELGAALRKIYTISKEDEEEAKKYWQYIEMGAYKNEDTVEIKRTKIL